LVDDGAVDGGDGKGGLLAPLATARCADDHDVAGNGDLRRGKRLGIGEDGARAGRGARGSAMGTATSR
jgi:hypothetical protein